MAVRTGVLVQVLGPGVGDGVGEDGLGEREVCAFVEVEGCRVAIQ